MKVYTYEVTMKQQGTLTLTDLPLNVGDNVEVIIIPRIKNNEPSNERYPFWNKPLTFINPIDPVATSDWEVLS